MQQHVTFSSGNIVLIDKIDPETDLFEPVPGNTGTRSRSFMPVVKLLIGNKFSQSISINVLPDFTPDELQEICGFEDRISKRRSYRVLVRRGKDQPFVHEGFRQWIQQQDLVDPTRFAYFPG